jgi:hypothetical protein
VHLRIPAGVAGLLRCGAGRVPERWAHGCHPFHPSTTPGSGPASGRRAPLHLATPRRCCTTGQCGSSGGREGTKAADACKALALRLVSDRMYTRRGLRDKLVDRGYAASVAEEGVLYLETLRLLDDVEYARAFARMKWRSSRWAPSRVRMALQQKSVATADIDKGLRAAAAEYQLDDEEEGRHEGPSPNPNCNSSWGYFLRRVL